MTYRLPSEISQRHQCETEDKPVQNSKPVVPAIGWQPTDANVLRDHCVQLIAQTDPLSIPFCPISNFYFIAQQTTIILVQIPQPTL